MPAITEPSGWNWWCPDCATGDGPWDFEWDAANAAGKHNEENHKLEEPPCQSAQ